MLKLVGTLRGLVAREDALLAPVASGDVDPPALHEMARKPHANLLAVERAVRKSWSSRLSSRSNAASSPLCGVAVSRIRWRSRSLGEPLEQLEPLLPALVRADAGMRLVDDDQRRAGARKAVAAPLGLDVVEADHGVGMGVEQRLRGGQAALQPRRRGGGDSDCVEIELRS